MINYVGKFFEGHSMNGSKTEIFLKCIINVLMRPKHPLGQLSVGGSLYLQNMHAFVVDCFEES
jgi:hypothetical protein